MPLRTAHHAVTVMRDGKHVRVRRDMVFDFTEEELAFIGDVQPDALRRPINESRDLTAEDVEKANAPLRTDAPHPAPARGRRTSASKDDDEL